MTCWKLAREGQKGHYFFRDNVPFGTTYFAEELVRILNTRGART